MTGMREVGVNVKSFRIRLVIKIFLQRQISMPTLITTLKSPRYRRWKQGLPYLKAMLSEVDGKMAKSKFRRVKNAVCSDHLLLEKDIRKKPAIGLITGFFDGGG